MMKGFYVTMLDGVRVAWLLGPFAKHSAALAAVPAARAKAQDIDPRACWYSFGTASIERDVATAQDIDPRACWYSFGTASIERDVATVADMPPGKLNDHLPDSLESAAE